MLHKKFNIIKTASDVYDFKDFAKYDNKYVILCKRRPVYERDETGKRIDTLSYTSTYFPAYGHFCNGDFADIFIYKRVVDVKKLSTSYCLLNTKNQDKIKMPSPNEAMAFYDCETSYNAIYVANELNSMNK